MDYVRSYFGKSLDELIYQDVEDFFSETREETTRIELKSYSTKYGNFKKNLEGVIRGLCALLNSEGGMLIWGAPEGRRVEGKTEKIFQGALSPVDELREKDGLINTISDTITPLPTGIAVKVLNNDSNQYVYVFEVQVSNYRPHQYKHIYYARLDGQTRPAPHYFVEALMRRITYPNLEGYLKITDRKVTDRRSYVLDIEVGILNFSELQNEENVILGIFVVPGVFKGWQLRGNSDKLRFFEDGHHLRVENVLQTLHYGYPISYPESIEICNDQFVNDEELRVKYGEIFITLSFGGRYSPMKRSRYCINVLKDVTKQNYNELIVDRKENIDIAGAQGKDALKEYLGR